MNILTNKKHLNETQKDKKEIKGHKLILIFVFDDQF